MKNKQRKVDELPKNNLLTYKTDDDLVKVNVYVDGETMWLNQAQVPRFAAENIERSPSRKKRFLQQAVL